MAVFLTGPSHCHLQFQPGSLRAFLHFVHTDSLVQTAQGQKVLGRVELELEQFALGGVSRFGEGLLRGESVSGEGVEGGEVLDEFVDVLEE